MLKRLFAASFLAVALALAVGVDRLHAQQCYMECEMWIYPDYTITVCVFQGCG